MLVKLAELFGVTTDYLLGREAHSRLDVSGLSETETAHIRQLIADLNNRK